MRLLHTSDWHVGKAIRGHSRADEHRAVFDEIVTYCRQHSVDVVLVAGDLFETASPSAEAESIVYRALLDLAGTGAEVAVIAGNHDNARKLNAVAPVFAASQRIRVLAAPAAPNNGGVIESRTRSGELLRLAMLPFVSQRGVVRARDLMEAQAYERAQSYANRLGLILKDLSNSFRADSVNVIMAHAFVDGSTRGTGERDVHFIDEYALSPQAFPATASYVALGHIHRPQVVRGACPIHYCGSPLQLDFGEQQQAKQVNLVEVQPGLPPKVKPLPLSGGRDLQTLEGSLEEVEAHATEITGQPWLRVNLREPHSAGIADRVRELLGAHGERVVDVRITGGPKQTIRKPSRTGRSSIELFDAFLSERNVADDRVRELFKELLEDQQGSGRALAASKADSR